VAAPKLLAVTVLTSLEDGDLESIGLRGPRKDRCCGWGSSRSRRARTASSARRWRCGRCGPRSGRAAARGRRAARGRERGRSAAHGHARATVAEGADYLVSAGRCAMRATAAAADAIARELDAGRGA